MGKEFKVLQRCDAEDEGDPEEPVFWIERQPLEFEYGYPDAGTIGRAYGPGTYLLWPPDAYDLHEKIVVADEPLYSFKDSDA